MVHRFGIIVFTFGGAFACRESTSEMHGVNTPAPIFKAIPTATIAARTRVVETESEAVEIAVNAWIPIYGSKQIEEEKPYHASLKNGIWTVEGSLPEGWVGGVAIARISQKNGKVLETGHGK